MTDNNYQLSYSFPSLSVFKRVNFCCKVLDAIVSIQFLMELLCKINNEVQLLNIIEQISKFMGNQNGQASNNSNEPPKILLKLRTREIILHYAFKMTLNISDIAIFPHELQGLKLWDNDIIISRYIILESEKFRSKNVLIFRAGVGIAGITLRKWTDAKEVAMCDFRDEVIKNQSSNCAKNGAKNIHFFKINYDQMLKLAIKYDKIIFPDLLSQGFPPLLIIDIIRKLLNLDGQAIIIMQQNKQLAKSFIHVINKQQFKISNYILTAEQYETSPLLNKLQGQKQFPNVSSANFYAISLIKLEQQKIKVQNSINNAQKSGNSIMKVDNYQQQRGKQAIYPKNKVQNVQNNKRQFINEEIKQSKKDIVREQDIQNEIIVPVSLQIKNKIEKDSENSPHKELNLKEIQKQEGKQHLSLKLVEKNNQHIQKVQQIPQKKQTSVKQNKIVDNEEQLKQKVYESQLKEKTQLNQSIKVHNAQRVQINHQQISQQIIQKSQKQQVGKMEENNPPQIQQKIAKEHIQAIQQDQNLNQQIENSNNAQYQKEFEEEKEKEDENKQQCQQNQN